MTFFYGTVSPRYPLPNTETEQWMTWIDDNMAHSSHSIETVGGFLQGNFINYLLIFNNIGCFLTISFKYTAVLEDVFRDDVEMSIQLNLVNDNLVPNSLILPSQLTRRVDALYLLSLLLTGTQRSKVQEMLAKLGIGPLLSALFEQFLWK